MRKPAMVWLVLVGIVGCGRSGTEQASAPPLLSISQSTDATATKIVELLSQGESDRALQQATEFVQRQPQNAAAYDARATVYHKLGLLDPALADLDQAVELDPQNPRLRNNRGFIRLSKQRFDEALADFEEANRLAPQYANAYNNRGLVEIAQGRFRQAIVDLDKALELDANYVDAYNNRGFAYLQLNRVDRALADFNKALSLSPAYVNAFNNRGLAKQHMGDLEGAVLDFTQAMMLDPQNPKYYGHRREAYLLQDLQEQAREDERKIAFLVKIRELTAAVQLKPNDPAPYLARARHYQQQGDETHALDDIERALKFAPDNISALLSRAAVRLEAKQYQSAIADCDAVLAVEPNLTAYSLRGDCRLALHELDAAIADFEQSKRLDSAVGEAYYQKSQELARQGSAAEAEAFLQRAKKQQLAADAVHVPDDAQRQLARKEIPNLLQRAAERLEAQHYQSAIEDCDAVLAIEPSLTAYSLRGDCRLAMNEIDAALADFALAKRLDEKVAEAYFRKSQQLARDGAAEESQTYLRRAVALEPEIRERVR